MGRTTGIGIYEKTVYQVGRYNITVDDRGLTIVENEGATNQHILLIDPVAAKFIGDVLNKAAATIPAPKRIRKSRAKDTPMTDKNIKNIKVLAESVKRLSPGMDKPKADIAEANAALPKDAPHQTTLDEQIAAADPEPDTDTWNAMQMRAEDYGDGNA